MKTPVLKILMLEDSDTDAEMIQRLLQKSELNCQFRVMMTRAALEKSLQEFMPDVILSDNAMPQFSASEALEVIKQQQLHIPFILVTGTVSEEFAASIIKAGADDYLLKDRLTRLPAAIEAALKQKQNEREKIESAEKLLQSEKRFRALVENNEGIIALLDKDLNSVFRSSSATRLTGWTNEEFAKVDVKQYIHPGDMERLQLVMKKALENPGKPIYHSLRIKHKNGHYIWLEGALNNMMHDPVVGGMISNMRDVTDKVEAEQKIIKANRLYFFISQINQMIVRTTDETALFTEVCQIAVAVGKFRMAWIGMLDEQTKKLIPVMHAGEERGYLAAIDQLSIDNIPGACGPTGSSLQEKEYIICNDIENHKATWKEAALERGYGSSMSLPVKKFGKVVGTFSVYASEKDFFDAEEIALLEEATGDISFALEVFEKENLRQKAEEAVVKSEQRYHTLTDVSPVGIFHTDASGSTTYVNPRWSKISGLSFEEGLDYGWLKAVHEEDKVELIKGWEKATAIKELSTSEYRFVSHDGVITWVLGQATPERNEMGEVVGYVGTVTDITEQKNAEEKIIKSEKRFRKLVENADDAFAILDAGGRASYVSSSVKRVLGYSEEEVYSMDMLSLVHPDNIEEVKKTLQQVIENPGVPVSGHISRLLHKDGTYHWFEDTITNLIDDPDIGGIIDNFRDVTERVNNQNALAESEEKHRDIVENITDILCTHDLEGNILSVNATAKKALGYETEQLLRMKIQDLLQASTQDRFKNYIDLINKNGFAQGLMFVQNSEAEKKVWEFKNTLRVVEGKPSFVYGFARDVTERIDAEEALRTANERFEFLAKATNDIVWDWNLITQEVWWNDNYFDLLGIQKDGTAGIDSWEDIIHKKDRKRVLNSIHKAIDNGAGIWEEEYRCISKDGNEMFIYDRGFILYDETGKPYRMIGSMFDITERKNAEEAIKVSEEQYRTLVEQASNGIFIADNTGKFVIVNSSGSRLSGYSIEELKNLTIYDLVHPESLAADPFHFEEMHQPMGARSERKMRCKNGETVDVEISAKFLSDKRFIAFIRDISERIKAQNEIIKEKNLSDSIINSLPASFFMINNEGKMLRWNKHLENASKYSSEEVANMHPLDFFIPAHKPMLMEKITNVFLAGEDSMEATVELKTKERLPYYFKGIAIEYDGMSCIMGVGIDISERFKAQEEIKRTNEKLRELTTHLLNVREEERKRIGREIHDELGQQLTAIKMDVSWIDKKVSGETMLVKNKLKNIITLLDGSNQSIRRILSELRPGILDDNGLVEALEWLNRKFIAQTGIPVEFDADEMELKLPEPVSTCIFRVYQETFTNITRYAGASKVTASLTIKKGTICVTVEDDGVGFDIVQAQNKKSFGILGMRERILALKGSFQLISQPGKGTKIIIVLPTGI